MMRRGESEGCATLTAQEYKLLDICANPIAWYDTLSPEEKGSALRCAVSGDVATFAKLLSKAFKDNSRHPSQPFTAIKVNEGALVFA